MCCCSFSHVIHCIPRHICLSHRARSTVSQKNEFNLREGRSESSVQCVTTQLRQQDAELYSKRQDCERSRQEQYAHCRFLAYLPCRPRAQVRILNLSPSARPDSSALSTDDVHISLERRKEGSTGRPDTPNRGGSDTARDLALNSVSDSRRTFAFREKVVRIPFKKSRFLRTCSTISRSTKRLGGYF